MAIKDAVVNLILKATNAVSPATDEAATSLYDAQQRADGLVAELKKLDQQAAKISDFQTLSSETKSLASAMQAAQMEVARLQTEMRGSQAPSAALRAEFANAKTAAQLATSAFKTQQTTLSRLSSDLGKAGIDSKALGTAEATLKTRITETSAGVKQASLDIAKYSKEQENAKSSGEGFAGMLGKLKTLLIAGAGAAALKGLVSVTDQYKQLEGQLRLVTDGQADLNDTFGKLHQLANDTRAPLDATVNLYVKLKQNTQDLGVSNEQLLTVTRAIAQSFAVSGASADDANRAIVQLSRGLAKGHVELQDLKSVAESSPRTMQALAEGLGVTTAELLKMAGQGKLTSEALITAFSKTADSIAADAAKIPDTVGQALTQLHNDVVAAFGKEDATKPLTEGINEFRAVITDPGIVQGLSSFAAGVATLAKWGVEAAAGMADFARNLGNAVAALVEGGADQDIQTLQHHLETLRSTLNQPWYNRTLGTLFSDNADIQVQIDNTRDRLFSLGVSYDETGEKGKKSAEAQTAAQKEAQAEIDNTTEAVRRQKDDADAVGAAFKALGLDQQKLLLGISEGAAKAVGAYGDLAAKIDTVAGTATSKAAAMAQAFDKALAAADTKQALDDLGIVLKSAFDKGIIGAQQYRQEQDQIAQKQLGVNAQVADSFKLLGLDQQKVFDSINGGSQKAVAAFVQVAATIAASAGTAEEKAAAIGQAFDKAFAAADTKDSLGALATALRDAFSQGAIGADQYNQELDKVKQKQDQLTNGTAAATAVKKDSAQASREQAAAEKEAADAAEKHKQEVEALAQAEQDHLGAGAALKNLYDGLRSTLAASGEAAGQLFDKLMNSDAAAGGVRSLVDYTKTLAASFDHVNALVQEQQTRVQSAMSLQNGNLAQFIGYAQQALASASLLGDQQLSGLRSALQSARQQMQGLKDDAASTLNSLESSLAQAKGDAAEVEQLRYQQQVAQLTAKLAAAQTAGDKQAIADLQKSIELARQLHDQNVINAAKSAGDTAATTAAQTRAQANAKADAQAEAARAADANKVSPWGSGTLNISLRGPSNTTAQVVANSKNDADNLLKILEEAGLRTT